MPLDTLISLLDAKLLQLVYIEIIPLFVASPVLNRVVAVLLDTISKNMLTQTHVRNENHV